HLHELDDGTNRPLDDFVYGLGQSIDVDPDAVRHDQLHGRKPVGVVDDQSIRLIDRAPRLRPLARVSGCTMNPQDMAIFGGSGSPRLTQRICDYLGVPKGLSEVIRFSEGNLFVRVRENVRGRHVYLVQSTAFPANDNFMELLFWLDAFKRASVASVTAVVPYFSYAKGDKKDEPRVSIRARVCADAIEAAGADRVVTLDLHAPQVQGFFRIPVDDLYALPVLCRAVRAKRLEHLVVVSPDAGFAKKARLYATALGCSLALADKERVAHDEKAEVLEIIGAVTGKTALVVDDFTISAGTLCEVADTLIA